MTGLERNSDVVFAASYAPLLQVRLPLVLLRLARVQLLTSHASTSTRLNGCVLVVSLTEPLNLKLITRRQT